MADRTQYVTLGVAEELFAVPVERVVEILETRAVARLPRAPENLLGVIDVRGQGIPVVELRRTLCLPSIPDDQDTRIIVLNVNAGGKAVTLGIKTDRVHEVTVFDSEDLEGAPEGAFRWRDNVIAGIGRRNGAFATVLDLDRLFNGPDVAETLGVASRPDAHSA